jgi:two-component system, NtrC family, sensor histidine kinase HydH
MLSTPLVSGQSFLDSLKAYVAFTEGSSRLLRDAFPLLAPHVGRIIDDFYATIEAHPGARGAITGGAPQIERLKHTLRRWLEELFVGPHDEAYFERRARIGRMHVRIDLPQAYMFTAMNRIRIQATEALRESLLADPTRLQDTLVAMHQIMDMDLAIMLETYREDLMARNRRAERLATIGQFAAGIGHELRNPLGVIESSVFLLRHHLAGLDLDPKITRHLDKISTEVARSNKTISDLLELARNRPPLGQATALDDLIQTSLAEAHLPPTVQVTTRIPPGAEGLLDPDQVRRVLVNLLVNAGQAVLGHGQVAVEVERGEQTSRFRVRDSGPGVPDEVRHQIFEPLFTTKAKGNGIGLALSRRIAEAHGGTLVLEPSPTGAQFLMTIPDLQPMAAP